MLYYLIMTPVIYLSSVYYPMDQFALPLRLIGYCNPLTWGTDVCRYFLLGVEGEYILIESIAVLLFFIISFILSVKVMNNDNLLLK